jgi:hypothetical protein
VELKRGQQKEKYPFSVRLERKINEKVRNTSEKRKKEIQF